MATYVALLEHEPGLSYGVWFPDLLGCTSGGETAEEAMKNAHVALELHLEGMLEDGDSIPNPSPVESIAKNPEHVGQLPFLVSVQIEKTRPIQLNVSLDERLVESIDAEAKRTGKSRSAFLADAAREALRKAG